MAEGSSETPRPNREFHITPKTSRQQLAEFGWVGGARSVVAENMIQNAQELVSDVPWRAVLRNVSIRENNREQRGQVAVERSVAAPLGSLAQVMGWDMSSPEVVYMSGYYFLWASGIPWRKSSERVVDIESGKIQFVSEEARAENLRMHRDKSGMLGMFRKKLRESLDEYAGQNLSNPKYQELLRGLLFIGGQKDARRIRTGERNQVLRLLRQGDIDGANELLQTALSHVVPRSTISTDVDLQV